MSTAAARLLDHPFELKDWVEEIKQLIEQGHTGQAQRLVDAFGVCHPTEVWPHILKAWLATKNQEPRRALKEIEIAFQSPLHSSLNEDEKNFIQNLRRQNETALNIPISSNRLEAQPAEQVQAQQQLIEILPRRPISVKKLAFYLPQFHPIPENDEWWGEGFTEWTNVSRAKPFFPSHWQPRRPGAMGFYDLRVPATMNKQFELAQRYGVDGFCFYYYWFNGKKLLEKPLEMLISGETDPFPFCICWVNENWSRSWDGMSGEVLIEANQSLEGTKAFIRDVKPVLMNENYIRVDGRPLLLIYCAQKLEDPEKTVQDWREFSRTSGIGELHICAVQSFGFDDPTPWGFDAAVEFPPHCVPHKHQGLTYCRELSPEERQKLGVTPVFKGEIRDYEFYAKCGSTRPKEPYLLYKGCMLSWDNTARRKELAHIYTNFSVQAYQDWLASCIDYCSRDNLNPHSESFVFINAWNEWAEGCSLEPDHHFGHALLQATHAASEQAKWNEPYTTYKNGFPLEPCDQSKYRNLIVFGHDGHFHGAQINLLNMVRFLTRTMKNKVHVFLINGGELVDAYKKLAPTTVIEEDLSRDQGGLPTLLCELKARGFNQAILNTVVTGSYTKLLKDHGYKVCNLIHELPNLIRSHQIEDRLREICRYSDDIVFSTNYVRKKIKDDFQVNTSKSRVLPQGINFNERYHEKRFVRQELRKKLGFGQNELVVMGCGFADFRKGIDIFVRVARETISKIKNARFIWVGRLDPSIESYIESDIASMGLERRILITGNIPHPFDYYLASDIFLLPSREDPLPSVVMEALDAGLPLVGFNEAGGFVELFEYGEIGTLVPYMDEGSMCEAILRIKTRLDNQESFEQNHEIARCHFNYVDYLNSLLACPSLSKKKPLSITRNPITVSAIIPNYNYKRYLGGRISSILRQNKSVDEIIFLDDCSQDGSLEYAESLLSHLEIPVSIVANKTNSGKVTRQWNKGITMSKFEYIWIAEADDYCEPHFNRELCQAISSSLEYDLSIAYCESYITSRTGEVGSTYASYYASIAEINGDLFNSSFILGGEDFILNYLGITNVILNASACLMNRAKLISLDWRELSEFQYSSDWLTYIRLAQLGSVNFTATPLNYHRRHGCSVTANGLDRQRSIYHEATQIHHKAASIIPDDSKRLDLKLKSRNWLHSSFPSIASRDNEQ